MGSVAGIITTKIQNIFQCVVKISQYRITICKTCFLRLCVIKSSIRHCGGAIWACPQPACAGWGRVLRYSPGTCPNLCVLRTSATYRAVAGSCHCACPERRMPIRDPLTHTCCRAAHFYTTPYPMLISHAQPHRDEITYCTLYKYESRGSRLRIGLAGKPTATIYADKFSVNKA